MPDFRVSPISIVNQIKSNLHDRYDPGYPILKELLQNADDSGASRFRLDALPGWPTAMNPLLRGPGLLVVNDGEFLEDDKRGITSFAESSKAADSAAIGKFGLGQKAVFHLCDAFVVYALGDGASFSTVVNPFLGVEVDGNVSRDWEPPSDSGLFDGDLSFLRGEFSIDFQDRCLALWLPFRREGLRPAPGVGFSNDFPSVSETIKDLFKLDGLRVLLTALRHLRSVEIREHGKTRCAIEVDNASGRLLGPKHWHSGVRSFGGTIKSRPDQLVGQFVGREAMIPDGRLADLRRTSHWPKTISVLSPKPQSEKGEPHGAATLLRTSNTASSQLRISWAVFLPISEAFDVTIPLDGSPLDQFRLLLHGYFFLDGGRRQIEGLTASAKDEDPGDASGLRRAWNSELRDSVVLPLLPALLRDALDSKVDKAVELSKRLLPIIFKPVSDFDIPEALRRLHFVRFDSGPGVTRPLARLSEALRRDLDWIREHTRFGELSARWQVRSRPGSLLLRADDLDAAKVWAAGRKAGAPEITDLQRAFLKASEEAEAARVAQSSAARGQTRRMRTLLGILFVGIVTVLAYIGWSNGSYLKLWTVRLIENLWPKVLTAQAELALKPKNTFKECANCPEMVVVPAGEFMMGSPWTEKGREANESPQHKVVIAVAFAVSRFEVTFDEWDACVALRGCPYHPPHDHYGGRGTRPVINVSWDDAQQYVSWLSRRTGKPYRLLSEAEWEYAARAGGTTAYSWGDEIGRGNAHCRDCGSPWDINQTAPVGSFSPNSFGLYDMHGNVWEWVQDCYQKTYYLAPTDGSSSTPKENCERVFRGGTRYGTSQYIRSAIRTGTLAEVRSPGGGFRVGRTLSPRADAITVEPGER